MKHVTPPCNPSVAVYRDGCRMREGYDRDYAWLVEPGRITLQTFYKTHYDVYTIQIGDTVYYIDAEAQDHGMLVNIQMSEAFLMNHRGSIVSTTKTVKIKPAPPKKPKK